jgi:hypothetical protein
MKYPLGQHLKAFAFQLPSNRFEKIKKSCKAVIHLVKYTYAIAADETYFLGR